MRVLHLVVAARDPHLSRFRRLSFYEDSYVYRHCCALWTKQLNSPLILGTSQAVVSLRTFEIIVVTIFVILENLWKSRRCESTYLQSIVSSVLLKAYFKVPSTRQTLRNCITPLAGALQEQPRHGKSWLARMFLPSTEWRARCHGCLWFISSRFTNWVP